MILAIWIRIAYFQNTVFQPPIIRGDAVSYVQYAFNLVNHGTFSKDRATVTKPPQPDAYWAPGYPAFIAAAMTLERRFGTDTYKTIIYSQAFMGSLIAALTLLIGGLFLSHYWALLAATLVVFSPHLISLGNYLLTETLFTLTLLLAIYAFLIAFQRQLRWLFAIAGLLFSACYMVNPVALFTPILFVGLAIALYKTKQRKSLSESTMLVAPCLLVFFMVVGTWAVREAVNVPADAPSGSSRLLTNLVIGSHDDYHAIWRADPRDPNNPAAVDSRFIEGSYTIFFSLMFDRIRQDPLHYANWYLIKKPIVLWDWNILVGQGDIYVYPVAFSLYDVSKVAIVTYVFMQATHFWLLGFAALGLLFAYRQFRMTASDAVDDSPLFIYLSIFYVSTIYVIAQAEPRYSIPLRPEMYLCAAYFLSQLVTYVQTRLSLAATKPT